MNDELAWIWFIPLLPVLLIWCPVAAVVWFTRLFPPEGGESPLRPWLDGVLRRSADHYPTLDTAIDELERTSTLATAAVAAMVGAVGAWILSGAGVTTSAGSLPAFATLAFGALAAVGASARRHLRRCVRENARAIEAEVKRYAHGLYFHPDDV